MLVLLIPVSVSTIDCKLFWLLIVFAFVASVAYVVLVAL